MSRKVPFLAALIAATGAASATAQDGQGVVLSTPGIDSLTIGGSARFRVESRDPMPPVTNAPSGNTQEARIRVNFDAAISDDVGAFVEFQESIFGTGTASATSLHQAYGSLNNLFEGTFDLDVGRFEMDYGNGRMISPVDWHNVGLVFDGLRAVWEGENTQLDLFATQPVAGPHIGSATGNDDISGAYFQWDGEDIDVDLYAISRRIGGIPDFADITFGGLVEGAPAPFDWSVELAFQTGDHGTVGATKINASGYALAAGGNYAFDNGASIGLGYEVATGADGNDDAFRPIAGDFHTYQGMADIVVWSNLQDIIIRGMVPISDGWDLHGAFHILSKHEDRDLVYTGAGGAGALSTNQSDIGTEIDIWLEGEVADSVPLWVGASQFMAGDAIRNGDDQLWLFAMTGFWF